MASEPTPVEVADEVNAGIHEKQHQRLHRPTVSAQQDNYRGVVNSVKRSREVGLIRSGCALWPNCAPIGHREGAQLLM